jgi:hypothetical protein
MKSAFNVGDLIRHSTMGHVINRGYGIVMEIMPTKIKCLWINNGTSSWIHSKYLRLIGRGQNGKSS